jgi:hypothetical protein
MYGLAAIEQANGWAMAAAGACIVLSGLTVLSFLISLLPRIPGISEQKPAPKEKPGAAPPVPKKTAPERLPTDINEAAKIVADLTEELGESFSLVDLHCQCKEVGLPNPHMSINRFREAGILISIGEGQFSWQPISE